MEGPSVLAEQNRDLTAIPSPIEIRDAIFGLKNNSSPGPDGFSRVFFTGCWHIISQDVISAITHSFSSGRLLRESNSYFLALILKIQSPETFSDFRPISLLNFTYKIISKILATRLSSILPSLISRHQSAFVKGRTIHHHVALVHDLFQKLNSKISGGSVCLKIDTTKAFDTLEWNFLFRALLFFNFSFGWINLIRELICTSKGSVLINKSPCGFFSSSCGLRQGDPLSLYLFILAEEILNLQIEGLKQLGKIVPISSVQSTPCHLPNVDDILLFMKAYKRGLSNIKEILSKYQASSGQEFNLQKSQLFLGKCNARRAHMVSSLIPIPQSSFPSVYLGVPLFFGNSRHVFFVKMLDSIRSRLAGWKSKCLSFAGRLIMVKHILSSIYLYTSLVILIPSKTCLQIERLLRNFLWSAIWRNCIVTSSNGKQSAYQN